MKENKDFKMIVLDSSLIVSFYNLRDENHSKDSIRLSGK
jgi:hypothetical protein